MKNSRQNLALIFFFSITILFSTSCNKDDDNEDDNQKATNDIHGTWTIGQSSVDLSVGGVDLVEYMTTTFGYSQQEADMMVGFFTNAMQAGSQGTITFNDDGTYKLVNSDGTENGTWSINNDGATLTLVFEGETDNLNIISLSSSSMKLAIPTDTEEVDLDGDDENETTISIDMELNLSK